MCTNPMDIFDDLNECTNVRRRKLSVKRRKLDLTCVVCGNVAHGKYFRREMHLSTLGHC